jgi:hypothetical protein
MYVKGVLQNNQTQMIVIIYFFLETRPNYYEENK